MFGDVTPLPVNEVQTTALRHASVPNTFESVHLAMIIAFTDQIAWVQKLKLTRDGDGDKHVDPSALTERAAQVADLIDNIVLSACPHLVILRLQHAWEVTRSLWPKPQHEEISSVPSPKAETDKMPGEWPEKLSLPDCPETLKGIISDMLKKFSEKGVSSKDTSIRAWEEGGRWKLGQLMPQAPSLGVALKNFSRGFYNRPTDPEERIEHAIRQADEVLSCIRFCHVIILTQLDVPPEWLWKAGLIGFFGALALVSSVSPVAVGAVAAEGIGLITGISLLSAGLMLGVGVGAVLLAYSESQQPRQLLLNFKSMVEMAIQVLGVEVSPLGSIETPFAELLKDDMATSDSVKTLEKWQRQLAVGIKKHPAIKGTCRIDPTIFWAKWLFNVARVGNLRDLMTKQIRVGIEGPSEAGKSQLLTALTGADPDTFRSGFGDSCRTMEIQIYKDARRDAVFIDCPGADDKDPRICEMARLFRNIFGILIFMIPSERTRSAATEKVLKEIAVFLRDRGPDLRPVRILLSKADQLESSRTREEKIRNSVAESKRIVIRDLRLLGKLSEDFVIHSHQACSDGLLRATETLDDIVQPFSTYAQMSDEGKKALSDCPEDEVRKIEGKSLFHSLYNLANEGALWDIPSLRGWLRGLSPESVPPSARVWQDE